MAAHKSTSLVPRLRFPEFRDAEEWESRKLGRIGEFIGGGTPNTSIPEFWGGDVQWFTPSEITGRYLSKSKRTITSEGLQHSSAKLLPAGTLLLSTRATIGDVGIADNPCATNQGFQSLVVFEHEANVFWYYWLLQHRRELIRRSSGSIFLEIGRMDLKQIPTLRPNYSEQTKIAECLGSLDDLIDATGKKIEALRQHKKGLMQKLFPQPGETAPRLRFPEFRGNGMWETKKLGSIVTKSKETFDPQRSHETPPVIELDGIEAKTGRILGLSTLEKKHSLKSRFQAGDILFGKLRPYLQKFARPSFAGVCSSEIWVLRSKGISSAFLLYLIQSKRFMQLANISSGSRMPRAEWSVLADAEFEIPQPSEQQKIAECLGSLDELIEATGKKVEALRQHKHGLMQQLFPSVEK